MRKIGIHTFVNSGLFGMFVAREIYRPDRIVLLGFDMHRRNGQHFFGKHERKLKNTIGKDEKKLINTDESLFEVHIRQFNLFSGCEVINCTPDSDLKKFPMANFRDII
jgi:hypothetical protein